MVEPAGRDFLVYIYGFVHRFVRTFSGRKRYSVFRTIGYATKKVLVVTNENYITATEVCRMLHKISPEYEGETVQMILDNAQYQKCRAVMDLVETLKIELDDIPLYSSSLKLIERLWRFVKNELHSRYYDDLSTF